MPSLTALSICAGAAGPVLQPRIDGISTDLAARLFPRAEHDVNGFLEHRGFGFARDSFPPHLKLAWEGFTQTLLDRGAFWAPPKPLPKAWRLFAWADNFSPMRPL